MRRRTEILVGYLALATLAGCVIEDVTPVLHDWGPEEQAADAGGSPTVPAADPSSQGPFTTAGLEPSDPPAQNPEPESASDCAPGTYRCEGALLQACDTSLETWVSQQLCSSEEECDAERGRCASDCTPGTYRCTDKELQLCGLDRKWTAQDTCETSALCDPVAHVCHAPACAVGVHACVGAQLTICNAGLTGWNVVATCGSAALCDVEAQICRVSICGVDEHRCSANQLERCNSTLSGWEPVQTCASAELCDAPGKSCTPPTCDADAYRCSSANLERCNSGRSGWELVKTCQSAALCDAPHRECDICVPGRATCVHDAPECDPAQGEFERLDICSSDGQALTKTCCAMMCIPNDPTMCNF